MFHCLRYEELVLKQLQRLWNLLPEEVGQSLDTYVRDQPEKFEVLDRALNACKQFFARSPDAVPLSPASQNLRTQAHAHFDWFVYSDHTFH